MVAVCTNANWAGWFRNHTAPIPVVVCDRQSVLFGFGSLIIRSLCISGTTPLRLVSLTTSPGSNCDPSTQTADEQNVAKHSKPRCLHTIWTNRRARDQYVDDKYGNQRQQSAIYRTKNATHQDQP